MTGAGILVTGTDTGVGKTKVALSLIAALQQNLLRVGAYKPCESGSTDDATALARATGEAEPSAVCSYSFALPAAPLIAARHEGITIDTGKLVADYRAIAAKHDVVIVEGAGGLLVPITASMTYAELAQYLGLSLVIVARPTLGTINHTRLTVEAARARRLPILGFVYSRQTLPRGVDEATNAAWTSQLTGVPFLGTLRQTETTCPEDLQTAASAILDLATRRPGQTS